MSLRARGPVGSAVRTVNVLSRFGASVAAMERRLDLYESITVDLGIHPTWPATACVLGRHPALLRRYAERGAELTVHGLVHGDHSRLGARLQRDTLSRATEIFERAGLRDSVVRICATTRRPSTSSASSNSGTTRARLSSFRWSTPSSRRRPRPADSRWRASSIPRSTPARSRSRLGCARVWSTSRWRSPTTRSSSSGSG